MTWGLYTYTLNVSAFHIIAGGIWGGSDTKGYKLEWVRGHQVERGQLPDRMLQALLPKSLVSNRDIRELAGPRAGGGPYLSLIFIIPRSSLDLVSKYMGIVYIPG